MALFFSKPHTQISASLSASLTIASITALIIWAELHSPLKAWLASTFIHHWLGKSVLAVVFFLVLWVLCLVWPTRRTDKDIPVYVHLLTVTSLLCALILVGFFIWHAYAV